MSWGAVFAVALVCVLASWWLLVRLCEHDGPHPVTVVVVISSALLCTTILSVSILALLRMAVA